MSGLLFARRALVKGGACALLAAAAPPRFLARAAEAASGRRKVLVAIFQRGAVDGLAMVVPHGDRDLAPARPSIGLAPPRRGASDGALDLDGFFALHPALAPLLPLWNDRSLAVIHACGSPDPTRSHFDAQDYMELGTPGSKHAPDGWLARAVAGLPARPSARQPRGPSPLRAVALGPALPRSLHGHAGAVALAGLERSRVRGPADIARGFEALYAATPDRRLGDLAGRLGGAGRAAFEAVRLIESAAAARGGPAHGASYPRGRFGEALRQTAQLIRADVGLEIAFADMDGWDTHAGQGAEQGQLAARLGELGGALAAFARDLGSLMADVVVLTMSEFGRTVAENGARGTDHGRATAMLILGGSVRGGRVYGSWPGLAREQRFEARDLAVTTDFRTLFAEVAEHHLGVAGGAQLFPGWEPSGPPLGVLAWGARGGAAQPAV